MPDLTTLSGIGPAMAKRLDKLGIGNTFDLLFHLPRQYQDRTQITPLNYLRPEQLAQIEGDIIQVEVVRGGKQMLLCHISDGIGVLVARFFHFNKFQHQALQSHAHIRCFGEVRAGKQFLEMTHPEYQLFNTADEIPLSEMLTPIYPTTAGITQGRLRQWISKALDISEHETLPDYLPEAIRQQFKLPSLLEALRFAHHPPTDANVTQLQTGTHPMQQRLIIEELLAHRLSLRRLRQQVHQTKAASLPPSKQLIPAFLQQLSFTLTQAQQRVAQEIKQDLSKPQAMMRLLQGDVGSGKTAIAELSALQAIEAGYQVALMAPTEILAEQHYQSIQRDFATLNIHTVCLISQRTAKEKKQILADIADGSAAMIIGTQALFQAKVQFHLLALVIIDEQHRFGVDQRRALQEKGAQLGLQPHQLVMTATPIPRTLAMTYYADLEISVLDELPPGRTPVKTILVSNQRRDEVTVRVAHACQEGRQAYWVCPLVEESELLNCQAAETTTEHLKTELPHLRIGLIHGRLKSSEKAEVMAAFQQGNIDLLVATTVIEVGVNVANASLMVIENAERLGLAQLHQLRGRVGRGSIESFCVLMYQIPISETAQSRLQIMRESNDGFKIAEKDLEIRGPGEVLGTRQTGEMCFKIALLLRDQALLPIAQHIADQLLQKYPETIMPLIQRWLGNVEHYARV